MSKLKNVILYIDTLGTKYHFYIDKKTRYYSILGGILTFIAFIISLGVFILGNIKQMNPSITTSILSNSTIIFPKNKIFLPWKISDDINKFRQNLDMIKFSNIYNDKKLIKYKLCNETSMINPKKSKKENKIILPVLEDLYCIDLGELFNNDYFFSYNIIFDFYSSNINNNSFILDLFYPIIEFNPDNFSDPLLNTYQKHSIYLNKNISIKEKIFLGEYSVLDKYGLFGTKEQFFSLMGTNKIFSENINVINNNLHTGIYTLNIILELRKVHYKRYHKNFTIFVNNFPICYIIFKLIKFILKYFILAESNSKIFELLFEKLVEKEDKSEIYKNKMKFRALGKSPDFKNINSNKKVINLRKNIEYLGNNIKYDNNNVFENEIKHINIDDIYNNISKNSQRNFQGLKLTKPTRKKTRRSLDFGNINYQKKK